MSFETEGSLESVGEEIVRLLQEIDQASRSSGEARKVFKEVTSCAGNIVGDPEVQAVEERERTLGAVVLRKGSAEQLAKQVRSANTARLYEIIKPQDGEAPIVTVYALADDAIRRNMQSTKGSQNEKFNSITGKITSIGEYSLMVENEEDSFLIYPTRFTTSEPIINIVATQPALVVESI